MTARVERVLPLLDAARTIRDPSSELGIEARRTLPESTGLSPAGVELALERSLEGEPDPTELQRFCDSVPDAPRAFVVLPANVFVAAHRAIALALASSSEVFVRPSRRDPTMTDLLARGAPGAFERVAEIDPRPGDHVWLYGSDESIDEIRATLPVGVVVHAHGAGIGVVVLGSTRGGERELRSVAARVVDDVVLFDQRGCLSPRLVISLCSAEATSSFAAILAHRLEVVAERIPIGALTDAEVADALRYRDTMCFADGVWVGGGVVGLDVTTESTIVPPVGRNVHVVRASALATIVEPVRRSIAAVGADGDAGLKDEIGGLLPGARVGPIGKMQAPPFDGPVDRRPSI